MHRVALTLALLGTLGCGGPRSAAPRSPLGVSTEFVDAPMELADPSDRAMARARFESMNLSDPQRVELRQALATELGHRARSARAAGDLDDAFAALLELASLWTATELAEPIVAAELAPYAELTASLLADVSRAGNDVHAAAALALLAVMRPERAEEYARELQLIFDYSDELEQAMWGEGAEGARPIAILEDVERSVHTPLVIDELVGLLVTRQRFFDAKIRDSGAQLDVALVRAHGDGVVRSAWLIVGILARANRLDEVPAALAPIKGIGDDGELRLAVQTALSEDAGPKEWIDLAGQFQSGDSDRRDLETTLAIVREGLRRHPRSVALHTAAGLTARAGNNLPLAIDHFERALALAPDSRDAAEQLSELYRVQIGQLVFAHRPRAAVAALRAAADFHASAAQRWSEPLRSDLAAAYATMGRGLVSLGELDDGREHLERSVALRPTIDALEYLGLIELKRDRFAAAVRHFSAALKLPATDVATTFDRARILRLAGEALAGHGDAKGAADRFRQALDSWKRLSSRVELTPRFAAEMHLEAGKAQWALGHRREALARIDAAIDADSDGSETYTDVVAFLIVNGQYPRALDAYHRALGSTAVSDYYKVFMSLWIVGEARRLDRTPDPLATSFLEERAGRLWYDDLARLATHRADVQALKTRATTRARRAELLYYAAVLGRTAEDPRAVEALLRRVVATEMVLFFEYDMAKHWLEQRYATASDSQQRATP